MQLPIAQTEEGEIAQSVPTQLPLNEIVQSPIAQLDTPLINMPRILALVSPRSLPLGKRLVGANLS